MIATRQEQALHLPKPYTLQRQIMRSPAKRKVVCAGRRAGKTLLGALLAIEGMIHLNQPVLITSPTQYQADAFWRYCKRWLSPLIQQGVIAKNETYRSLEMGNAWIKVKTGSDPDVLRGDEAGLIILDECALLLPDVWHAVCAPMLAKSNGTAVFLSTPRRKNWFYELYQRGVQGANKWQSWNFPSHANPYLSQEALAEIASDMTEEMYRQEILAEFLEGQGQVFRRVKENATLDYAQPYRGRFVMGIDWAQSHDYTVATIIDIERKQMVTMDRFNQVDWELQRGRVKRLFDIWKPEIIIGELNSIGSPNLEALRRDGLPIIGFQTTAQSKPPLIEGLVLALERNELKLLNERVLIGELEAYERVVSPLTNMSKYSAPDGLHDDCVMSLALAWHGLSKARAYRGIEVW